MALGVSAEVIKTDLGKVLLAAEDAAEKTIAAARTLSPPGRR
jgi:hypothetical protein